MKELILKVVGSALLVLVLASGYAAKSWLTGGEVGEPCTVSDDCKGNFVRWGTICVDDGEHAESYCTDRCASDAECPSGWTCEAGAFQDGMEAGACMMLSETTEVAAAH